MELTVKVWRPKLTRQWRWTAYAENNRKIANSGESYKNKADCVNIAKRLFPLALFDIRSRFTL